jgi:DNA-binding transcriptional MerR regulator
MSPKKSYTTVEVAKRAGIPRATLQYWISSGKLKVPEVQLVEGKATRLWSELDISRARKLKGSLKPGPKARLRTKK